jgi:hypothetical protein
VGGGEEVKKGGEGKIRVEKGKKCKHVLTSLVDTWMKKVKFISAPSIQIGALVGASSLGWG